MRRTVPRPEPHGTSVRMVIRRQDVWEKAAQERRLRSGQEQEGD